MAEINKAKLVRLMLAQTSITQGLKFLRDSGWKGEWVDEVNCEDALNTVLEQIGDTIRHARRQATEHTGKDLS